MKKIKVLYVSAECYPYAYVGGLGEVAAYLPKALLKRQDTEVVRVMPGHKEIEDKKILTDFPVPMGRGYDTCVLKTDPSNEEVLTYFLCNDRYFYRDNVYGYDDDGYRFFFLCSAVVEMLQHIPFQPDIIHLNDWHTGFVPLLLKRKNLNTKTVFTIHNIMYRGYIPKEYVEDLISEEEAVLLGSPGYLDFMKAAFLYSDMLTAVSPRYAEDLLREDISGDLEQLIKSRKDKPVGILNGIDMKAYDPSGDGVLKFPYSWDCSDNKKKNKRELQKKLGLPQEDVPLVSMVSRLERYKGIDLVLEAMEILKDEPFQLAVLGSGNSYYQGLLAEAAQRYPDKVRACFDYSSDLAKEIYAASDYYFMPSSYEPCGISQLYAMRYGAIPIVNPEGGLKDTVSEHPEFGNGFYMKKRDGESLAEAAKRAFSLYGTKELERIRINGMKADHSWDKSAAQYEELYAKMLDML
ncbi:MAG: glycogen synthase [Clostridia bacterium]|jgi:starch synthase